MLRFSIDDMPLGNHFYYVKPADGFELWPEMGTYYTMAFLATCCAALLAVARRWTRVHLIWSDRIDNVTCLLPT